MKDANHLLKKVRDKYYDKSQDHPVNEPKDLCTQYKNAKLQTNQCSISSQDSRKCCPKLSPISEERPKICLFSNTSLDPCFHKAYCEDIPTIENSSIYSTNPSYSNCDARPHASTILPKNNINVSTPLSSKFCFPPKERKPISSHCLDSTMDAQPNCSKCNVNNQCLLTNSKNETMKLKKQVELAKLDLECKQKRVDDRRLRLEKVYQDLEYNN